MKKLWILLPLVFLLAGCKGADYETVSDVYVQQELPAPAQVLVTLEPDAVEMTVEEEGTGSIYLCDGYTVTVETMSAGDLDATLRAATGYGREQLEVIETESDGVKRYECVWVCAGEGGDQVGRTVILDDGNYHYTVSLLTEAETAGELAQTWQNIAASVSLDIAT